MIDFHMRKTEDLSEYKNLGLIIRQVISEHDINIVNNLSEFSKALSEKNINTVQVMQLILFLEAGNIKNYLTQIKSGISMIDVNNMITCAEEETGLNKDRLKMLLTAMLYGLNLPTAIETVTIPKSNGSFRKVDTAIITAEQYSEKLKAIKQAVDNEDEKKLKELSTDFEMLIKAGVAEALYLKGMCHTRGIGTVADFRNGRPYFIAAANAGHAEANAVLGDYYFSESPQYDLTDYSKAFEYYTQIGAVALSDKRKENLNVIIASKKQNIIQLILTGILLILIIAFNWALGSGALSVNYHTHWGWAITSDILCAITYGLVIFWYYISRYDKTKWAAAAMFIITSISAFFAFI